MNHTPGEHTEEVSVQRGGEGGGRGETAVYVYVRAPVPRVRVSVQERTRRNIREGAPQRVNRERRR